MAKSFFRSSGRFSAGFQPFWPHSRPRHAVAGQVIRCGLWNRNVARFFEFGVTNVNEPTFEIDVLRFFVWTPLWGVNLWNHDAHTGVFLRGERISLLAGNASNGRQINILSNKLSNRKCVNRNLLTERICVPRHLGSLSTSIYRFAVLRRRPLRAAFFLCDT